MCIYVSLVFVPVAIANNHRAVTRLVSTISDPLVDQTSEPTTVREAERTFHLAIGKHDTILLEVLVAVVDRRWTGEAAIEAPMMIIDAAESTNGDRLRPVHSRRSWRSTGHRRLKHSSQCGQRPCLECVCTTRIWFVLKLFAFLLQQQQTHTQQPPPT